MKKFEIKKLMLFAFVILMITTNACSNNSGDNETDETEDIEQKGDDKPDKPLKPSIPNNTGKKDDSQNSKNNNKSDDDKQLKTKTPNNTGKKENTPNLNNNNEPKDDFRKKITELTKNFDMEVKIKDEYLTKKYFGDEEKEKKLVKEVAFKKFNKPANQLSVEEIKKVLDETRKKPSLEMIDFISDYWKKANNKIKTTSKYDLLNFFNLIENLLPGLNEAINNNNKSKLYETFLESAATKIQKEFQNQTS